METNLILGLTLILVTGLSVFLIVKYFKIRSANKKLEQKVAGFKNYIPGRKGIISDFALTQSSTKTDFKVTYEVEILEVSENKVKVSAVDFTSTDSFGQDPSNHLAIIGFFQKQWISKSEVELLVDKSDERDSKIEQILS